MKVTQYDNPNTEAIHLEIIIDRSELFHARPANNDVSRLIDDKQFLGMLQDVIWMRLGLEPERDDKP